MAEPQAAVTDTHPLIFHALGGKRLGKRASRLFSRCEHREAILYVPTAVIWECSLLVRAGRINLRRGVREFFDDLFSNPAYQPVDVSPGHVFLADEMQFHNDPFDALIVACAKTADLPLITRDAVIQDSGVVKVIW